MQTQLKARKMYDTTQRNISQEYDITFSIGDQMFVEIWRTHIWLGTVP